MSDIIWIVKADSDYAWSDGYSETVTENLIAVPTKSQALEHLSQIARELDLEFYDDTSFSAPTEKVGNATKNAFYYIESTKWED